MPIHLRKQIAICIVRLQYKLRRCCTHAVTNKSPNPTITQKEYKGATHAWIYDKNTTTWQRSIEGTVRLHKITRIHLPTHSSRYTYKNQCKKSNTNIQESLHCNINQQTSTPHAQYLVQTTPTSTTDSQPSETSRSRPATLSIRTYARCIWLSQNTNRSSRN